MDRCRHHGVWLDGGELRRLLEWKKAGGQLLHEQLNQKKQNQIQQTHAGAGSEGGNLEQMAESILAAERHKRVGRWDTDITPDHGYWRDDDLVSSMLRLLDKLF